MVSQTLPLFRYHPAPLATGAVTAQEVVCACCGERRPFVYDGPVYAEADELSGKICPWCIADGSAALRLGATFSDVRALERASVDAAVVTEIEQRTPGFIAWQTEEWLVHCGDACEFHGDATTDDLVNASDATKADWRLHNNMSEEDWAGLTDTHASDGNTAFYKFVCRHCGAVQIGWDCA